MFFYSNGSPGTEPVRPVWCSPLLVTDGRPAGPGSQRLRLPSRTHRLEVRKPGYESKQLSVLPDPGYSQTLEVELRSLAAARRSRCCRPSGPRIGGILPQDRRLTVHQPDRQVHPTAHLDDAPGVPALAAQVRVTSQAQVAELGGAMPPGRPMIFTRAGSNPPRPTKSPCCWKWPGEW